MQLRRSRSHENLDQSERSAAGDKEGGMAML